MARARNLKPGFFTNEILAEIEPLGRILFQGLWCHADREGRLEDRPRKLKVEILPYDECNVDELLNALAAKGFIIRYSVENVGYIQIVNFVKHQNPHVKESASAIPAPCEHCAGTVQVMDETGTSPASYLNPITDSLNHEKDDGPASRARAPKHAPEDMALAEEMKRAVLEVSPSAKPRIEKWADAIRLTRERDGHSLDEIRAMFWWANRDPFWRANILSPDKLREKWPTLEAQRSRKKLPRAGPQRPSAHSGFEQVDYSAGINPDGSF